MPRNKEKTNSCMLSLRSTQDESRRLKEERANLENEKKRFAEEFRQRELKLSEREQLLAEQVQRVDDVRPRSLLPISIIVECSTSITPDWVIL